MDTEVKGQSITEIRVDCYSHDTYPLHIKHWAHLFDSFYLSKKHTWNSQAHTLV